MNYDELVSYYQKSINLTKTETFLKKFNYPFLRGHNRLVVELKYSQRLIIDFSDTEKIVIEERLESLNFLTGLLGMNMKDAIIYNAIGLPIIGFLLSVLMDISIVQPELCFLLLAMVLWVVLWTIYYVMKFENLKRQLILWHREEEESS